MSPTTITRLSEWLLVVVADAGGSASPREALDAITARFGDQLSAEDVADDPDRPGIPLWQSRVYAARLLLGEDYLVVSNRDRWQLTDPGRNAATRARADVGPPAGPPGDETAAPRPVTPGLALLQPSVIATPLLDPIERARIGLATGDNDVLPIMIELNVNHQLGLAGALALLTRELEQLLGAAPTMYADDEYVQVSLSIVQIQQLVISDHAADGRPTADTGAIHRIWPNFSVDALIDSSIRTIKADAANRSFAASGDGITWAVIDSGIDGTHPHFETYATLSDPATVLLHRDFTVSTSPGPETAPTALIDEQGHGSHVAAIIAGGLPSDLAPEKLVVVSDQYIVSDQGAATFTPRSLRFDALSGMAPRTKLVSLKVLPKDGPSDMGRVMAALRYVRKTNENADKAMRIHGVNLSLGYEFDPRWFACGQSPLCAEVDRLVRSGVVVVVAAGNTGYGRFSALERLTNVGLAMTINDPGNAERAITVGSTHRTSPHTYGVSYFSSKGPTGDGRAKPDLLAPGERITSASTGDHALRHGLSREDPTVATYAEDTGTSFAAPHVSGAIAAFLSVRSEYIAQPEAVKTIFLNSAVSLGRGRFFEGAGLVDLMRALQDV